MYLSAIKNEKRSYLFISLTLTQSSNKFFVLFCFSSSSYLRIEKIGGKIQLSVLNPPLFFYFFSLYASFIDKLAKLQEIK